MDRVATNERTDGLGGDAKRASRPAQRPSRPIARSWPVGQLTTHYSQLAQRGRSLAVARRSIFARRAEAGFTFVELLVVCTLLLILASAIMPLAKVTVQRQRESELRRALREMRTAIDKFKDAADMGQISMFDIKTGSEGYPPDLETLVDGVSVVGDASGRKLKFLRRIPIDPMTNSTDWGMRSYQDRSDSTSWGGQNVFDVYTKSKGTALDGTKYIDW
jgi:general secretion pathway protein G